MFLPLLFPSHVDIGVDQVRVAIVWVFWPQPARRLILDIVRVVRMLEQVGGVTGSRGQIARGHAVPQRVTGGQRLGRPRGFVSFVPLLDNSLLSVTSSPKKILV